MTDSKPTESNSGQYCPETPTRAQEEWLQISTSRAVFAGGRASGKTTALLMAALRDVDDPNYSAILFSNNWLDLAVKGGMIDRFIRWIEPHVDVIWRPLILTAEFPSGAKVSFGYLDAATDYRRYSSSEFQFIGMDKIETIREKDYRYLISRLRQSPKRDLALRMRTTADESPPEWLTDHLAFYANYSNPDHNQ